MNSTHHYQGYGFKADIITNYEKLEIGLSLETIGPFIIEQKKYYSVGLSQSNLDKKVISNISNRIIYGLKYNLS